MPAAEPGMVSVLERLDGVSQAALSTADPQCLGNGSWTRGWVQFGCLRVAACVGWFLGLERRALPGTRPGEHPWLSVATAGAESRVRGHLVRLEIQLVSAFRQNWDSEGESESGMGVGRSPFIHCSPRLLLWEGVLPPSRMLKQGCPGGLGALWKPYPLLAHQG